MMLDKGWENKLEGEFPVGIKRCCVTDKWDGIITSTFAVRGLGGERAGWWDVRCNLRRMRKEAR